MSNNDIDITNAYHTYASFNDYDVATQAVGALLDHGIDKNRITVMLKESENSTIPLDAEPMMHQASEGITVTTADDMKEGAAKGASIGLGLGLIAGLAAILVPGAGLVIAGGALATAVGGAIGAGAAGALAGAVTGYLVDQGASEDTIQSVIQRIEHGNIVVGVDALDSVSKDIVNNILAKYEDVEVIKV